MLLSIFKKIASDRSRRVRKAFTQADFMDSSLTISHTRLPCLPSRQVSPCVPGNIEGSVDAGWV